MIDILEHLGILYLIIWFLQVVYTSLCILSYNQNIDSPFILITKKRYFIGLNPLWLFILIRNRIKQLE